MKLLVIKLPIKLYQDADWLRFQYITKKKTAKEIAEVLGVSEMTIYLYLKKFDLLRLKGKGRKLSKRVIKRDW